MTSLRGLAAMQIGSAIALAVTAYNRTTDPRVMVVMAVVNAIIGLLLFAIAAYLDRRNSYETHPTR